MDLLIALTYYKPYWSGLTQYAVRLAEGLAEKGHNIQVLCTQHKNKLPTEENINNVSVFRTPSLGRISRSQISPSFLIKFISLARENDAVVIYIPLMEVFPMVILCKLLGKKVFLCHNGDLLLPDGFINEVTNFLYEKTTSAAIRLSDGVTIFTEDYAQHSNVLANHKKKWKIILPPQENIDYSKIDPGKFVAKHHLEGKKLIGYSGRFVLEKGVDILLQAIPYVVKEIPNAHFVFAGDYKIPYENFFEGIKDLVEKNKESITLLGLIEDRNELMAFNKALSVLAQPSRKESFASSVVEAFHCGTPAVCTDTPGMRQNIKRTGMGLLVEKNNPQALAQRLIEVIKNRKKYIKPAKKIKQIYNREKILEQYENLFTRKQKKSKPSGGHKL